MRGEDGSGTFVGSGREISREGDADVRVETGSPHENEVLAQLVNAEVLWVDFMVWVLRIRRIEEKLESFSKTLPCVEILEFVGEESGVYGGGNSEKRGVWREGGRRRCAVW